VPGGGVRERRGILLRRAREAGRSAQTSGRRSDDHRRSRARMVLGLLDLGAVNHGQVDAARGAGARRNVRTASPFGSAAVAAAVGNRSCARGAGSGQARHAPATEGGKHTDVAPGNEQHDCDQGRDRPAPWILLAPEHDLMRIGTVAARDVPRRSTLVEPRPKRGRGRACSGPDGDSFYLPSSSSRSTLPE